MRGNVAAAGRRIIQTGTEVAIFAAAPAIKLAASTAALLQHAFIVSAASRQREVLETRSDEEGRDATSKLALVAEELRQLLQPVIQRAAPGVTP